MSEKMWRTVLVEPGRFVREQVECPSPRAGEVLVSAVCVGVCGSDISAYHGLHPYIHCPIVLGHEFSGIVSALGPGVSKPALGTRVTVIPHLVCGRCEACRRRDFNLCSELEVIGAQADGAHADYVAVPAGMAVPMPGEMSMEQAALVEPAAVSYHGMRRAGLGREDRVVVVGAGPIGNFAMQSARALGARAVYIADFNTRRLDLAQSLGADGVIDLGTLPMARGLDDLVGDAKEIDVWVDCVGYDGTALDGIMALARRGTRVVVVGVLGREYAIAHLGDFVEHELTLYGSTMYVPQDYEDVIEHMVAGRIRIDGVVTHTYRRDRIPEAFRMIDSGVEPCFKVLFADDAD